MAKTKLRCSRCKRTFSMPAHLARHMSAIHGKKARGKVAKGRAKKAKARVGRPKGVSSKIGLRPRKGAARILGEGSARVISEMQAYHNTLIAQRTSVDVQIDAFARAMKTLGAATPRRVKRRRPARGRPARGRPVGRAPRPGSLRDFIVRILRQSSRPMGPNEIGISVKRAGFKTKAKDLTKAVSNTIPAVTNIKKVGFGLYQYSSRAT